LKNRTKQNSEIEVFSNLEDLKLSLNGESQGAVKQGANECDFIWNVKLKKGKNVLKVTGAKEGKTYTDRIVLYNKGE